MALLLFVGGLLSVGTLPVPTRAAVGVNQTLNFQGRLLTAAGAVVADGTYNMEFKIYQDGTGTTVGNTGGTLKWTEDWVYATGGANDKRVTVKNGYFSLALGTTCVFTGGSCQGNTNAGINWNQDTLWLSMTVGDTSTAASFSAANPDTEMIPMRRLASSPYAINAGQLGGLAASAFGQLATAQTFSATNTFSNAVGVVLSGTPASGGSLLQVGSALGSGSTGGTLIGANTAITGDLINLQVSGSTKFKVDNGGNVTAGTLNGSTLSSSVLTFGAASAATVQAATNQNLQLTGQGTGDVVVPTDADTNLQVTAAAAPSVDQVVISNTGQAVTSAGINNLNLTFVGGAAAVESAAQQIDLTPGTTSGGTWSGLKVTQAATGPVSGITANGIKLEGPTTGGAGTYNALDINAIGATTTGGTVRGLNITGTASQAAGTVQGINLANLTAGAATETGINLGTGWDNLLTYNGSTVIINGSGQLNLAQVTGALGAANGGTGQTTYTVGDLLYASGTTALSRLADVASGSCLMSGGVGVAPAWSTCGSSSFTLAGTSGTNQTITSGSTLTVAAGANVTTTAGATNTLTVATVMNPSFTTSVTSPVITSSGALQVVAGGTNTTLNLDANGSGGVNLGTNATVSNVTVGSTGGGNVSLQSAATINLGNNANNKTINLGVTGTTANTTTINIGTSTGAAQTVAVGSTNAASTTTVSGGASGTTSPAILLQASSTTGAVVARATNDSATAFQVQGSGNLSYLNVDTVNDKLTINSGIGGALTSWATSSSALGTGQSFGAAVTANGYIYVLGGYSSAYQTTVQYAPIKSGGGLGTWVTTTALPAARSYTVSSVVVYSNYIYVVGGTADGTNGNTTVYYAKLNSDGSVGGWNTLAVLPAARMGAAVTVANGYIYALGGNAASSTPANTVYYSGINSDGSLGGWITSATTLPVSYGYASTFIANGRVYYLGGANSAGTSQTGVYYASIDPITGDVGTFTTNGTSMPTATSNASAVYYNGYAYIMNGGADAYYYAPVTSGGAIGMWSSTVSMSPMTARTGTTTVSYNGYMYALGGFTASAGQTAIYVASAPRTLVSGALDLIGLSDGIVAGDEAVGGSLTAGNTNVVGQLNVQSQATFSQNLSVAGNLTVGQEDSFYNYNSMTVNSNGYAGINLNGDLTNSNSAPAEPGGAFINMSVDGTTSTGTIGVTQTAGKSPDGLTNVTGALANALEVGQTQGSGALQFMTSSTSAGSNVRMTIMYGTTGNTTRVCINVTSCTHELGVSGTITASGAITGSGTPDIAETIAGAPDVEAADVVMADPASTERVVKATGTYQPAALGVISDGTSTFMINAHAGDESAPLTGKPLVLAGRVPVKVTNEGGAIKPGDYLTTSSTPGKAMKATRAGSTIGKALGFFDGTTGTVLVLVNVSYYDPSGGMQGGNASVQMLSVAGDAVISGNLTVSGLTTVADIVVRGHLSTAGATPAGSALAAAGNGAVVGVTGNDTAGEITVTTGAAPVADSLAKLVFDKPFGRAPQVVLTPVGKGSSAVAVYVDGVSATGFELGAGTVPGPHTTYMFSYHVIGTTD